ncbi:MAG: GNAT family N-acetyltransferase [Sphingomonadales bacterium]|nr:GNAT family N-acetyltransferase [Sphingomonadales bacterium]
MADFALGTERLILRAWREEDHAPLLAMCRDPAVMEHLGPPLDAQAAIDRQNAWQAKHGHCFWAIERRADGAMLGFCGLKPGPEKTPIENRVEIGWRLRADAWGQGYAREAAQASLAWGFANLDEDRIWAITVPANSRSWGLMERLGMTRHEDLDFDHPALPADSPLLRHITYSIAR